MHPAAERNDPALQETRQKWASEIGRFVMAFGGIEGFTYQALRKLPRDPIATALNSLSLAVRLDLLIAIAGSQGGPEWAKFAEILTDVKALAGRRNLIAHNGVGFDVYIKPDGTILVDEVIRNAKVHRPKQQKPKERDRVAFAELVQHREQAEKLEAALMEALFDVMKVLAGVRRWDVVETYDDDQ